MKQLAKSYIEPFSSDIDVSKPMSALSVAQQQIVEIIKALSRNAKILILDKPTESRRRADAFIAENKVDMIVSLTTIGMFTAGEALKSSNSDIKLTGLGLPIIMKDYILKRL